MSGFSLVDESMFLRKSRGGGRYEGSVKSLSNYGHWAVDGDRWRGLIVERKPSVPDSSTPDSNDNDGDDDDDDDGNDDE